jgi:predicted transport protein
MYDHHGDFEIAAQKALGSDIEVDWSDIRVICIAPNYKKYDLHAVQVMGANLELWTYRLFKNDCLYLEEVLQKSFTSSTDGGPTDGGKPLTAGQKAAISRATGSYKWEDHVNNKSDKIKQLAQNIREFILDLDPAIEEAPKKFYVAYKISQNIACMELQKQRILLYLKLDPKEAKAPAKISRDVSKIGHFGTGDLELSLRSIDDFQSITDLIQLAYQKVGG